MGAFDARNAGQFSLDGHGYEGLHVFGRHAGVEDGDHDIGDDDFGHGFTGKGKIGVEARAHDENEQDEDGGSSIDGGIGEFHGWGRGSPVSRE